MMGDNTKAWIGWWLLLAFSLILIIVAFQGAAGRMLAVLVAPNHLIVEHP